MTARRIVFFTFSPPSSQCAWESLINEHSSNLERRVKFRLQLFHKQLELLHKQLELLHQIF